MNKAEVISFLKDHIQFAASAVEVDRDNAREYAYQMVCIDIYHQGKEERQQTLRAAARFHDGRASGRESEVKTLKTLLEHIEKKVDT